MARQFRIVMEARDVDAKIASIKQETDARLAELKEQRKGILQTMTPEQKQKYKVSAQKKVAS